MVVVPRSSGKSKDDAGAGGMSRAAKKRAKKKKKREKHQKVPDDEKRLETDDKDIPNKRLREEEKVTPDVAALEKKKRRKLKVSSQSDDHREDQENEKIRDHDELGSGVDDDDDDENLVAMKGPSTDGGVLAPLDFSNLVDLIQSEEMMAKDKAHAALQFLVQPAGLTVGQFYERYWEKEPLCVQAETEEHRHRLDGFLSLERIRQLVQQHDICYGRDLNVTRYEKAKDGVKRRITLDEVPGSGEEAIKVESARLWNDHYKNGCSIRLLCPHKHVDPIHSLLSSLELEWGCMVGANAYLTPPGESQGFAPHYDDIDAFCLQLEGRKRWRVYAPLNKMERLPRTSSEDYTDEDLKEVEPVLDVVLEPGDVLYMPRGWIHQAVTLSSKKEHSLHLTVSTMQQWAWADLLDIAIPEALASVVGGESTALRAGLPRGFLEYTGVQNDNDDQKVPAVLRRKGEDDESEEGNDDRARKHHSLKEAFKETAKKHIARVANEAMNLLDASCDQLARRFLSDRLPPALSAEEIATSSNGQQAALKILPNMLCRLVRPTIARLILEDGKAVVYHCADNSRVYHETELSPLEFELDDGPAIEQLLTTTEPHWICVADLIHDSIEDKVGVTQALFDEGILSVRPLDA